MGEADSSRLKPAAVAGIAALAAVCVIGLLVLLRRAGPQERGEFVKRPAAPVSDVTKSEDAYDVVNPSIKGTFVKGLKDRDWAALGKALAPGFRARWPRAGEGVELPDATLVLREYRGGGWREAGAAEFVEVLKEHVSGWESVERTTWRPFEFLADEGGRTAFATVHFQVAGSKPGGARADLSGIVRAGMVSADGKAWLLDRLEWVEGERAEGRQAPWRDVTDACGLSIPEGDEVRRMREQVINDRGVVTLGGLSVCDWNGDGFPDVAATRAGSEMALFLNDGRGGFVRTDPPARAAAEAGYTPLLVDLDNDGVDEALTGAVLSCEGATAYVGLYVRRGAGWELRPKAFAAPLARGVRGVIVQGIVPGDVDGDGDLDLFFCNYSNIESDALRFNRVASFDGMDNWLFINQGNLGFREESDARGITGTQFSYVAKVWDFDSDGDLDIFEGNDFGPNHLWENDGTAKFRDATEHVFGADSNYTMGVTIADWDNTGDWTMYISNMYSHAGNRIVPLARALSPEMRRLGMVLAQGNQMYERRGGAWAETGVARGVNWADWAWSCVFFDADNDRDRDIFVANGYTTNTDKAAPDF